MSRCRECRHVLGAAAPANEHARLGPPGQPDAGAVAVCVYCGCFAVFTGNGLETREPTVAEAMELESDLEAIAAQAAAAVYRDVL